MLTKGRQEGGAGTLAFPAGRAYLSAHGQTCSRFFPYGRRCDRVGGCRDWGVPGADQQDHVAAGVEAVAAGYGAGAAADVGLESICGLRAGILRRRHQRDDRDGCRDGGSYPAAGLVDGRAPVVGEPALSARCIVCACEPGCAAAGGGGGVWPCAGAVACVSPDKS